MDAAARDVVGIFRRSLNRGQSIFATCGVQPFSQLLSTGAQLRVVDVFAGRLEEFYLNVFLKFENPLNSGVDETKTQINIPWFQTRPCCCRSHTCQGVAASD